MVVIREVVGLGSKNGSSVEEKDGQGGLEGWKDGRRSRAHGTQVVAPTL